MLFDLVMPGTLFHALVVCVAVGVPLYAWRARGRTYAIFAAVILGFSLPGMWLAHARFAAWLAPPLLPGLHAVFIASIAATAAHLVHLVNARLRSRAFRLLVSIPGQVALAAGFMTGLWLLALLPLRGGLWLAGQTALLDALRWLDFAPFFVALVSIATSRRLPADVVRIELGEPGPPALARVAAPRHPVGRAPRPAERPLRIAQISDPHLGPWQSVRSLRRVIEDLLAREPDLVLLTGDYLTMEGHGTPGALAEALAPLQKRAGDCYAIFGNHDHEAPDLVREAMAHSGVRLLIDEEAIAATPLGPVQLIGVDWVRRERRAHLEALLARHPRRPGMLRLLLMHDPSAVHQLPEDDVDLVLSGHTHGGQVGLLSLGLDWTVLSRSRWPDHGLFARGRTRLYVHRGTGFYGFPLRVGVPGEASLIEVVGTQAAWQHSRDGRAAGDQDA